MTRPAVSRIVGGLAMVMLWAGGAREVAAVVEAPAPMHTAVRFEVDDSGAATYAIPIVVPPGTGGMQPELSLVYNTRAPQGMMGVGWSLSGLSVIHRCPADYARDTFIDGVDFDSNDRFCLDGQRLVPEDGSYSGYGSNGFEYRTERESFARVISYGTAGVGPQSFKVWTKSGLLMEYGVTGDSRIQAQGKSSVRVWAVNRIEDTAGNAITVSYLEDGTNGQYVPNRIDFPYDLSVRFEYENFPTVPVLYLSGSLIKNYSRLKTIRTYTGSTLVREYRLVYDTSGSTLRSRLTSVTECGADGSCLPATSVEWIDRTNNDFPSGEGTTNPAGQDGNLDDYAPLFADFDGDGLVDVFWEKKRTDVAKTTVDCVATCARYLWLNQGGGSFEVRAAPTTNGRHDGYRPAVVDLNGDGRADLFWEKKQSDGRTWDVGNTYPRDIWYGTASGDFQVVQNPTSLQTNGRMNSCDPIIADFNGDGRSDIFWVRLLGDLRVWDPGDNAQTRDLWLSRGDGTFDKFQNVKMTSGRLDQTMPHVADFTGDGLPDVMWDQKHPDGRTEDLSTNANVRDLWINQGTGTSWSVKQSFYPTGGALQYTMPHVGDFNGDGIADIFWDRKYADGRTYNPGGGETREVWLGKGDGTFKEVPYPSGAGNYDSYRLYVADLNADGRSDVFWSRENADFQAVGNYKISIADGDGGFTVLTSGGFFYSNRNVHLADLNGDGLTDQYWVSADTSRRATGGATTIRFNSLRAGRVVPDLAKKVTDGLGAVRSVAYKPITDDAVYAPGGSAGYPNLILRPLMFVVSSASVSNGIGGTNATTYHYTEARTFTGAGSSVSWRSRQPRRPRVFGPSLATAASIQRPACGKRSRPSPRPVP